MPIKTVEFTKTVSVKLTPDMYRLVVAMRRVYGNDADVVRAGIMTQWREFVTLFGVTLPDAEELDAPPAPADE